MLSGYPADLRIDRALAQLLRLRVSAAQQLHLLPQPALRGGARGRHTPGEDRHPDGVVGDRASLRGRAGGSPLCRGAHPCRRHRPGRGVPALPRRARRELQPGGDPRDRRRRRQHERLDPDQAGGGRDAGPGLSSAVATKPAAAATPPRAGHLLQDPHKDGRTSPATHGDAVAPGASAGRSCTARGADAGHAMAETSRVWRDSR